MRQLFFYIVILLCFCYCNSKTKNLEKIQNLERPDKTIIEKSQGSVKSEIKIEHKTKFSNEIGIVFVTAENGLTYREKPDINSNKIGTFDFGSKLAVIEKTGIHFEAQDENNNVNGEWIKVSIKDYTWKKNYKNQTGYVFSGFTVDSLNADFNKLPRHYEFSKPQESIIEFHELNITLSEITISEFNEYKFPVIKKKHTKVEPLKTVGNPQIGGFFFLETDEGILKFSCNEVFSGSCYVYEGFLKELNAYTIGQQGEGIYESFLLDKNNGSIFRLSTSYDDGNYNMNISTSKKKLIITSSIDYDRYKEFYDSRSVLIIYDLKNIRNLNDIKNAYIFKSKNWEISRVYWINDESFVLEVFDKTKKDINGMQVPVDSKYMKAIID